MITTTPHATGTDVVLSVYEQGLNLRDRTVFDALVAPDYVNHESAGLAVTSIGPQNWVDVVERLGSSFPDVSWRVDRTIEAGNQVWLEATMSGTHRGPVLGFPPTGRRFEVRQVHMLRLEAGRIAEHWAVRDDLGMLVQLGLYGGPTPPSRDSL